MSIKAIRVVVLGYPGAQTLDIAGPLDAFGSANNARPASYATLTTSGDGAPFVSESGLRITPDCAIADAGPIDTLIVPGGATLRQSAMGDLIADTVREQAPRCRRIVSVCTGIYGVAPAGLLDGRRATTHWRFARDVAERFPAIRLECDRLFVKDGPLYSSAGITAAIDLSLALMEEDYGPTLALAVARDLVVYVKRPGGQLQYSEPLRFQTRAGNRFADLAAWIASNLDGDLSIDALAARTGLGARQFTRRFTDTFGMTPSQQIETLRLDAARDYLTTTPAHIDAIAATVGFRSDDAFRRAFERRFGVSPTDYRQRFGQTIPHPPGDTHAEIAPPSVVHTADLATDRRDQ